MRARRMLAVIVLSLVPALALAAEPQVRRNPYVSKPVTPDVVNVDLSTFPIVNLEARTFDVEVPRDRSRPLVAPPPAPRGPIADPVRQALTFPERTPPAPSLSFEGTSYTGFRPPDTVGDVGPNHYIQMVNVVFAIYDKSGAILAGPSDISSLWAASSITACKNNDDGDPVVLYDPIADRWLISQFADSRPSSVSPCGATGCVECIAISQSGDPVSGGWYLYGFPLTEFPDYPKLGVWPDAYYMGANADASNSRVYAFDRTRMLSGLSATFQSFTFSVVGYHSVLLPSDLDGPRLPPLGAPNIFYHYVDDVWGVGVDRYELYAFHVDFTTPGNSMFTGPTNLTMASYTSLCNFDFDCVSQPITTQKLDSVTEWPMWRLQYRNFGNRQTLVGNHSVNLGSDRAGIRWFELKKVGGGAWSIAQQSTWSGPGGDTGNRWMGSIAMDGIGNMALAHSFTDPSVATPVFASLRYTGRLDGDAASTMTQGERVLFAGAGCAVSPPASQCTQTTSNRWGDYSSMNVDPVDDCTFWYTSEYMSTGNEWHTRILRFKFPLCGDLIFRNGFQ